MEVPLKTAKLAFSIFPTLENSVKYGNPNAVSDAGVGAIHALACIESAVLNVRINLSSIKDEELVRKISMECDELENKGKNYKDDLIKLVNNKINS